MKLSIVIPIYNEVESLPELHRGLHTVLDLPHGTIESITDLQPSSELPYKVKNTAYDWEVVYVDDGSKDGSPAVMEQLATSDPEHTRAIFLRRNFGQTAAIVAGIDHSVGDIIVLMDADLQNDPADIPMMVEQINQGYDVVSGWRVNRQDTFLRRLPSQIANGLISRVTGVHLHDYGCTLKAYRREVLTGFRLYGEMHRFIPAYAHSVGARMIEVPVRHHVRKFGKAKYGLERTFKVILDLFTVKFLMSYANKPIYLFGGAGFSLIGLSLVMLLILVLRRLLIGEHMIRSPLLLMSTMFFILGFQSILMGLIAELLARTYHESQAKPIYTIRKVILNRDVTS